MSLTNEDFAPDILTADPRIREWSDRVIDNARSRVFLANDQRAKQEAEDQFQTSLTQYRLSHENDLERVRDDYNRDLDLCSEIHIEQTLNDAKKKWQDEVDEAKSRPVIFDPIARKKRRGSISTINSPIITKHQPLDNLTSSIAPDSLSSSIVPDSQPTPSIDPQPPLVTYARPKPICHSVTCRQTY